MWTIERRAELVDMRARTPSVLLGIAGLLCFLWYLVEPWFVTFVDDGPYYSTDFATPTDRLPIYSRIELRRFGRVAYILESRLIDEDRPSVLLLRDVDGSVVWSRIPEKPDGSLGPISLGKHYLTWYAGWKVAIKPSFQEGGYLYLSAFAGFRFFNHSW